MEGTNRKNNALDHSFNPTSTHVMNETRPSPFLAVSRFVYYTECKPKNKKWGRPGNEAIRGVGKVERQPGRTVRPRTPTVQGTAVVCNIEGSITDISICTYTNAIKQLCRLAAYKTQKACSGIIRTVYEKRLLVDN